MTAWRDSVPPIIPEWAPSAGARLAAAALVKRRFPMLRGALEASDVVPLELSIAAPDGVVGWGGRMQADLARRYARMRKLRYWSLEDGFVRSVGLGKAGHDAVSIVVDDLGLHHDPGLQSRLERLILDGSTDADIDYARQVRTRLIEGRLTKYNLKEDDRLELPRSGKSRRILLVDQVANDASIAHYGPAAFRRMWADALDQDAEILLRDHPDVIAGFATGILRRISEASNRFVLDGRGAIDKVLAEVDEVWTVSSQFGFEALLRGKRVMTYGMPFYAGWGLTQDCADDPASSTARARRAPRTATLDELVAAALVRYPIYFDPVENKRVGLDRALDRLSAWKREAHRFVGSHICIGFSRHKRKTARLFMEMPAADVSFKTALPVSRRSSSTKPRLVVWGRATEVPHGQPHFTVEDGFIRSAGLGAEFARARSLCIDPVGIYYDATRPSLLENILNETVFDDALLQRARHLRASIIDSRISKYNISKQPFDASCLKTDRPIALVAEQVPDDASLQFGMPVHGNSLDLLCWVRKTRPRHFIVFKRHPDILSGARRSEYSSLDFWGHADYVLDRKVDIGWRGIDECHSSTSQIGFEALLRNVKTYCYGAPFYSGWGLTNDSTQIHRRRRKLSLDELVAGALILYPSYRCWRSRLPCEPEDVIRDIISDRDGQPLRTAGQYHEDG
ncbi:capsular polysaccharide biosynthesis protein [Bradyrhizobium sp.]|uniref:capsular polysaccharide biosynthesis protein n=1 Tax=Bradyrhizobium sp. TaxID=376 RepID=UPI0039E3E49A